MLAKQQVDLMSLPISNEVFRAKAQAWLIDLL